MKKEPAKKSLLSRDDLEKIDRANVANILRKQKAGKVLTPREEEKLRAAAGQDEDGRGTRDEGGEESDRVWLTPAEFERWLPAQGVKLSHQCLYKTYCGKAATNPLPRNARNDRVHKWKGLELIRIVQGKQDVFVDTILRRRQEASARVIEAKAAAAELEQAARAGNLLDAGLVKETWTRAIEGLKNEFRALSHTLPGELVGLDENEIRAKLDANLRHTLHHLAVTYGNEKPAPAGNPSGENFQGLEKP